MKLSDFDFDLPADAIAQRPATPRDAARLLDLTGEGFADRRFGELPSLLRPGDLLVVNDTRVIPARLAGRRGEARIEVTLIEDLGARRWRALARPARRLRAGQRIDFAPGFGAEVAGKGPAGDVTLAFDRDRDALLAALDAHGRMPLPPYLKRATGDDENDRTDYQTVYARHTGAIAAPTAGLHFTPGLFAELERAGIGSAALTLHVGAGTFLPVKTDDVGEHTMHAEWGEIETATANAVAAARAAGGRIVAVGTTSLRLLETAAREDGRVRPFAGATDLFITPGFRFRVADLLLTNFHLPRSTLFMLVCAFAGTERMKAAYSHAVETGYRFYSYGDCCLLRRSGAR